MVRRRGRLYVICKSNPRFKAVQGNLCKTNPFLSFDYGFLGSAMSVLAHGHHHEKVRTQAQIDAANGIF